MSSSPLSASAAMSSLAELFREKTGEAAAEMVLAYGGMMSKMMQSIAARQAAEAALGPLTADTVEDAPLESSCMRWMLSGAPLQDRVEGLKALVHDAPVLNFQDTGVGADQLECLAAALQSHTCLDTLDLSENPFGAEGLPYLLRALPSMKSLRCLSVSGCEIDNAGAIALIEAIADSNLSALTCLDLSGNPITAACVARVLSALTRTSVASINISAILGADDVMLPVAAVSALSLLPSSCLHLSRVYMQGFHVPGVQKAALLSCLQQSETLVVVDAEFVDDRTREVLERNQHRYSAWGRRGGLVRLQARCVSVTAARAAGSSASGHSSDCLDEEGNPSATKRQAKGGVEDACPLPSPLASALAPADPHCALLLSSLQLPSVCRRVVSFL